MIGFDAAQALLAEAVAPLDSEAVPLAAAAGRVLAEAVHAALPSPRHDVAAMDGFALREGDAVPGARLRLIGESYAGGPPPPPVGPGEAVRIFTGAPLPRGADLVIMQENCDTADGLVTIARAFGPGRHVRRQGSDFAAGDLLLAAGRHLDPQAMVALAGADRAEARVHRRPRLALIATGDELAPPGSAAANSQTIPESVSFGVAAMAARYGAELVARFTGADDLPALERTVAAALKSADLVVVTGGASVGARDFAKAMFAPSGLDLLFAKVAIRPGKPVWLGRADGRWVLGLPGNPTSALVTARLFLAPLLAALQGQAPGDALDWISLPLGAPLPPAGERETFARAVWRANALHTVSNQDSGAQGALAEAAWLIRCPAGSGAHEAGQCVSALRF
jgi:molybdopterin molybdotransferase